MKLLLSIVVLSLSFNSNVQSEDKVPQPPVEQGESWEKEDVQNTDVVLDVFRKQLIASTGDSPHMKRDAHPKHHGCVKGELKIDNKNLKTAEKVGLFSSNGRYGVLARFSNGDPNHKKADDKNDVRGLALKVLGVPYDNYLAKTGIEKASPVHDFVLMNASEFFIKNSKDYRKLMLALDGGGLSMAWFALTHPRFIANLLKATTQKVANPLDVDFHSAVPYKLGKTSMKMKFASCKKNKDKKPKNPHEDFLGHRLDESLKKGEACFTFYIQPNRDPKKNDIENSTKEWKTKKSPFIKVGKLTFSKQNDIRSKERMDYCEKVTFNPWRAAEENRPMGAVNRIRLEVYVKQAKFRSKYNKVEIPMPASLNQIP